jgi:hypothetical protein
MSRLTFIARKLGDYPTSASHAALALGIALAIAPTWSRADTQVRGTPKAVVVEAQNASVKEILIALADAFEVQFKSSSNLDKRLTGTYEGTLQQAVSRILKGYDFVVKSGAAGLEISLLGAGEPVAVAKTRLPQMAAATASANVPQPATTAGSADRAMPVPSSGGGPVPPINLVQGPSPVPTPPAPDATGPRPMPQVGAGSGSGPALVPTPAGSGAMPPAPQPTSSTAGPPVGTASPSTPAVSPSTAPSPSARWAPLGWQIARARASMRARVDISSSRARRPADAEVGAVLSRPAVNAGVFSGSHGCARTIASSFLLMMIGSVYLSSNLFVKSGTTVDAEYIAWRGMLAGPRSFDHALRGNKLALSEFREVVHSRLFHSNASYWPPRGLR